MLPVWIHEFKYSSLEVCQLSICRARKKCQGHPRYYDGSITRCLQTNDQTVFHCSLHLLRSIHIQLLQAFEKEQLAIGWYVWNAFASRKSNFWWINGNSNRQIAQRNEAWFRVPRHACEQFGGHGFMRSILCLYSALAWRRLAHARLHWP